MLLAAVIVFVIAALPLVQATAFQSCTGGGGGGGIITCLGGSDPYGFTDGSSGSVGPLCSPIILDVAGNGFQLTSAANGVQFDISGTGKPIQLAWTAPGSNNAFLALPGPDGLVHNGKELFGNFTPQPPSASPNGYIALAQFDKPENGGNGDGVIDSKDPVFSRLRLWIDENHDGICQPAELHQLPQLGVVSIALNYKESRRMDRYGNEFRYRSRISLVDQQNGSQAGPLAYDVFLVTGQN